jgi:hypothetical protein
MIGVLRKGVTPYRMLVNVDLAAFGQGGIGLLRTRKRI